jgi:hypothetical protein
MALRILSGLIWANPSQVPQSGGFARITFNPLALATATPGVELRKTKTIGPAADFLSRPAAIIAARQFILGSGAGKTLGINDTINATEMTIRWRGAAAGNVHEEIPFLIVGEIADPPPPVDFIVIRVPDKKVRQRLYEMLGGYVVPEPSFEPGKQQKKKKRQARSKRARTSPRRRS